MRAISSGLPLALAVSLLTAGCDQLAYLDEFEDEPPHWAHHPDNQVIAYAFQVNADLVFAAIGDASVPVDGLADRTVRLRVSAGSTYRVVMVCATEAGPVTVSVVGTHRPRNPPSKEDEVFAVDCLDETSPIPPPLPPSSVDPSLAPLQISVAAELPGESLSVVGRAGDVEVYRGPLPPLLPSISDGRVPSVTVISERRSPERSIVRTTTRPNPRGNPMSQYALWQPFAELKWRQRDNGLLDLTWPGGARILVSDMEASVSDEEGRRAIFHYHNLEPSRSLLFTSIPILLPNVPGYRPEWRPDRTGVHRRTLWLRRTAGGSVPDEQTFALDELLAASP